MRSPGRPLAVSLVMVLLVAACSVGAPHSSPAPTTPPPTPTPVPGDPGGGGSGGGGSGGGGGIVDPGGPGGDPMDGDATIVSPIPGQLDTHPVSVQRIRATVDGRHVQVELRWWGGVAPCSVLDSVRVERSDDARTIALTAIEGSSARDVACIMIAQLIATVVDLGELGPGSWIISAAGDAQPIVVEIV